MPPRLRVAAVQYLIRPIEAFEQFAEQVTGVVHAAADNGCRLVVLPEYFTLQLLTLGDTSLPGYRQVRRLARRVPEFVELMSGLARGRGVYIVAGSIPNRDDDAEGDEVDVPVYNDSFVFGPSGDHRVQGKLHMTRWEAEDWRVSTRRGLKVFEADFGKFAVAICYDVEFPELARAAAREGADVLVVPSCTDDRQGFCRVRYCAQARAIENTMYVVHTGTVGSLPMVSSVAMNYGQAAILTPSDFPFARDGVLAEGQSNLEMTVIGELDLGTLRHAREHGTVLPLRDSVTTAAALSRVDTVAL